jgi:threonine efflux protein
MTSHLLSVALLWGAGVKIPGPNFLLVTHGALNGSRRLALWSVLGLALGTVVWGTAGAVGIGVLFAVAPWFYVGFKVVGGLYLVWLGVRMIMASRRAHPSGGPPAASNASPGRAVARGFLTVITNPKSAAFTAGIFAAVLPADPTFGLAAAAVAVSVMVAISVLWYGGVAWSLGYGTPRRLYHRCRRRIEIVAGGLFVLFGVSLASSR